MALFKIFNNFDNRKKSISTISSHQPGYCYFDASTNKFYIDTPEEDGSTKLKQLNGTFFGECETEASVATKIINIDGFDLVKGVSVFVKFTVTNSAAVADLKLNISNTGNISIKRYGTTNLPSASNLTAGMVCQFIYDGTNWLWVGHIDTNSDTKVRQELSSNTDNVNRPLLLSYANNSNTTTNIDNIVYRTNNIYVNPVTGNLTATNFIGTINGHSVNIDVPANAKFTDTTYTIGGGLNLNSDNILSNSGVRSISAGDTKGTLSVNIGGQTREIVIPGFYDTDGQDISDTYSTKAETVTNVNWDNSNKKLTQTINNITTDIVSIGTIKTALNLSKNDVGLNQVENTKLSTWIGTDKITTVGTLSSGSIPWTLLTDIPSSFTPSTHQHGNINNNGTISSNGIEIENNDSFIFIDSSNSNKIEHSSQKFDGTTINKALTQKGTFETFVVPSSLDAYAKKSSPSFTGVPTAPTAAANTNTTQIATTAFVMDALSRVDIDGAFVFKGLISKVADLPTSNYEIGWVYKIETPGTYFGQYCETGDTIYCKSINGNDDDWVILQSNIDGAVIGDTVNGSTVNHIAVFSGTTGKVIKDGGYTIADINKYHKTGTWSELTYTASAVNGAEELKFTLPTASTSKAGVVQLSSATDNSSEILAATAKAVKAAYDLAASKTNNTGTVTKVSTGAGLTGGDITGTGTIKANLTSETKLTNAATDEIETSGRVYPIRLDKNGKLAVNVPWENPTVINENVTLSWGSQSTIATINDTDITVTLPSLPVYTGAGTWE